MREYSCSPGAVGATLRVGEVKCTWLSCREMPTERANNLPPKFDKYLVQLKGYCYALHTLYGRLYVYFVNGNYDRPYVPQLLAWDVNFASADLESNWRMLMNHATHKGMLT